MKKIGIIVGSLREESYSKKIAEEVAKLFPKEFSTTFVNISDLPLYNPDIDHEENEEKTYIAFRQEVHSLDAILFVTPEYNRSVPGVLKNAIDVGSRPISENVWSEKPAGIITISMGNLGGFGANHHLRQTLSIFDMDIVQRPEVYLSKVHTLLNENGELKEQETIDFLQTFVDQLIVKIEKR